jgi:hypothetical protein
MLAQIDIADSFQEMLSTVINFLPQLLAFIVILVVVVVLEIVLIFLGDRLLAPGLSACGPGFLGTSGHAGAEQPQPCRRHEQRRADQERGQPAGISTQDTRRQGEHDVAHHPTQT